MSNVWVIEEGDYSDYKVVGVFSTQENAQLVRDAIQGGEVSCWPLDPSVEELRQGMELFLVRMLHDGTTEYVEKCHIDSFTLPARFWIWRRTQAPAYKGTGIPDCLDAIVWAKDVQGAVKATNEHRAMMIASGQWE